MQTAKNQITKLDNNTCCYSRNGLIRAGFLNDVTITAEDAGFDCPVAITKEAWDVCLNEILGDDLIMLCLWDIVVCASLAFKYGIGPEYHFEVIISGHEYNVEINGVKTLKLVHDVTDEGSFALTIGLALE